MPLTDKDMLPLAGLLGQEAAEDFFSSRLAVRLVASQPIFWLMILHYIRLRAAVGLVLTRELISAPRLDNLSSVQACLEGVLLAASVRLGSMLWHYLTMKRSEAERSKVPDRCYLPRCWNGSIYPSGWRVKIIWQPSRRYMFSVDAAHAVHPNVPEKSDPTNRTLLNGGVVLKTSATQSYAGDCEAVAIAKALCQKHEIKAQHFVNRSDVAGGSTLGSIASTLVPIHCGYWCQDVWPCVPCSGGYRAADQQSLEKLLRAFFRKHKKRMPVLRIVVLSSILLVGVN